MKPIDKITNRAAIAGILIVAVLTVAMCALTVYWLGESRYFVFMMIFDIALGAVFIGLIFLTAFIRNKSRKALEEMALVEPVTKGYSRARFDREAEALIKRASEGAYSLVAVDVQRFKLINDQYGDSVGNDALRLVHEAIGSQLKKGEIHCRSHSDRFVALMFAETREKIGERLKSIAAKVNEHNLNENETYYIPLAFGVYRLSDKNQSIILAADRANVARKSVKGSALHQDLCVIGFYNDEERLRMLNEKYMFDRMKAALANREFKVYLQPKNSLKTKQTVGAEALVRWLDPDKGLLNPDDFIPMFEHNGFVVDLDLFVFDSVLQTMTNWQKAGLPLIPVSVNLSRAHLIDPRFFDKFLAVFSRYSIPAAYIEFEFTETLFVENLELLRQIIKTLHTHGFTCSMDDFGSGYSSLNTLKDVEVDVIKLDRAFFGNPGNKRANTVIEAVVHLAGQLNMQTVAEGVETKEQALYLKKIGCSLVQGYVCAPPLTPDEFVKYAF